MFLSFFYLNCVCGFVVVVVVAVVLSMKSDCYCILGTLVTILGVS